MVENFQKNAIKNGDFSKQAEVRKEMMLRLKPIGEVIREEDKKLNTSIRNLLSEKQYKKWIKYNRKNYKIFPKAQ
jgi:L-lactate utilization protein LutC